MSFTSFLDDGSNAVTSTTNYIQEQTANLGSAVSTVNQVAGAAESALSAIGLGSVFGDTVGAVLANGFTLSCWGASLTPQTATTAIKRTYQPYFTALLSKFNTAGTPAEKMEAFNQFVKAIYVINKYYAIYKITEAGWSTCAKKAINEVYKPFFATIQSQADKILGDFIAQGAIKRTDTLKPLFYFIPKEMTGETTQYQFKNPPQAKDWSVDYPVITRPTVNVPVTDVANTTVPDPEHTTAFGPKFPEEGSSNPSGENDGSNPDDKKGVSPLQIAIGLWGLTRLF